MNIGIIATLCLQVTLGLFLVNSIEHHNENVIGLLLGLAVTFGITKMLNMIKKYKHIKVA